MSLIQKYHKAMYGREYYLDHKNEIIERVKQHYENNKEEIKQHKIEYYEEKKEEIRKQQKIYYQQNKEKLNIKYKNENNIKYYKKNFHLQEYENNFILEMIKIKKNKNIKNKLINYLILVKEFYNIETN